MSKDINKSPFFSWRAKLCTSYIFTNPRSQFFLCLEKLTTNLPFLSSPSPCHTIDNIGRRNHHSPHHQLLNFLLLTVSYERASSPPFLTLSSSCPSKNSLSYSLWWFRSIRNPHVNGTTCMSRIPKRTASPRTPTNIVPLSNYQPSLRASSTKRLPPPPPPLSTPSMQSFFPLT